MAFDLNAARSVLAEAKARILETDENRGFGDDSIVRCWDGITRDNLDLCARLLIDYTSADNEEVGQTVTSPMTGTQWAKAGTWYGGRVFFRFDEKQNLMLCQVLHKEGTALEDVVTENSCRYQVETTWYFAAAALPELPEADADNGITYRMGGVSLNPETGLYTLNVDKRTRLYQTTGEYVSQQSAAVEIKEEKHTGVSDAAEAGLALPSLAAAVQGKILRRDRSRNEDCTQDITDQELAPKDQTFESLEESAARSVALAGHTEAAEALPAPVQVDGVVKRVRNQETEAGNQRTEAETITPHDQVGSEYEDSAARAREVVTHSEGAALAAPTAGAGEIVRRRSVPTEAGNAATVDETITPKDQTFSTKEESAARSVAVAGHTEAAAALPAPVQEDGVVKRVRNQETEAGNQRTEAETITPHDQVGSEHEVSAELVRTVATHSESTELEAPTQTDGRIFRRRSVPTEAGGFQTVDDEQECSLLDTGWVLYPDAYGNAYVRTMEHATAAELAAVVADLVAGEQNSLYVQKDGFNRFSVRASRGLGAGANLTTYYGELGTTTSILKDRERRADADDPGGYKWRIIAVYTREYIGLVFGGGSALMGAWYNITENRSGGKQYADSDSILPKPIGLNGGYTVYRSVRIERTYPATWSGSATDEEANS